MIVQRAPPCAAVLACAHFLGSTGAAVAQSDDIATAITDLSPAFYWKLENSFAMDDWDPDYRFTALEKGGPDQQGSFVSGTEYFPILPPHETDVPSSPALIFSETLYDYAGTQRYLELGEAGSQDPIEWLGMNAKNNWTLHMIVHPDDDPMGSRGPETVFFVGVDDDLVWVEVDVEIINMVKKVTVLAGREPQTHGHPSITTGFTAGDALQIIVRYYNDPNVNKGDSHEVTLDVHRLGNSPLKTILLNNQSVGASTGSLLIGANEETTLGKHFNGAIHHLAVWKTPLANSDLDSLFDAAQVAPPARSALTVDWQEDPRFFMWIRPINSSSLGMMERDLANWNDPIWTHESVWPIVRYFSFDPYGTSDDARAPGATAPNPTTVGVLEAKALQAAQWIDYVTTEFNSVNNPTRTLDGNYALFPQQFGYIPKYDPLDPFNYYTDLGSVRALSRNWRDAPSAFRNASPSPLLQLDLHEVHIPFFREGMSQNAFWSKEIFWRLKYMLADVYELPAPSRLHMDTEMKTNINHSLYDDKLMTCDTGLGWWHWADADDRAGTTAFWAPGTTFDDVINPQRLCERPYHEDNHAFSKSLKSFATEQYDYAMHYGLIAPAIQELNPDIRTSEYYVMPAGTDDKQVFDGKAYLPVENADLAYLDFGSPVLYPIKTGQVDTGDTYPLDVWASALELPYTLQTDGKAASTATQTEVEEDLDNIFVDRSKHNINAVYLASGGYAGAPIAPWIIMEGNTRNFSGVYDDYDTEPFDGIYTVSRYETARIAVFAYRHGVREFLVWGWDELSTATGLDYVIDAVEYAADPLDVTTTGATARSYAAFGVPDGVVDCDDYTYFVARYNENTMSARELEADIYHSVIDQYYPDGSVNSADLTAFEALWDELASDPCDEATCLADCDPSTGPGVLDVFDYLCFQNQFLSGDPRACGCDESTGRGVCDIFDFLCFQDAFLAGCP